jgi:hypothetical protein
MKKINTRENDTNISHILSPYWWQHAYGTLCIRNVEENDDSGVFNNIIPVFTRTTWPVIEHRNS